MPVAHGPGRAAILFAALACAAHSAEPDGLRLKLDSECRSCAALDERLPAAADAIVPVQVNLEPKGDYVVLLTQADEVLLREEDARALGLPDAGAPRIVRAGRRYLSLGTMPGVRFSFDRDTLALSIRVDPGALGRRQAIDLGPQRAANVRRPPPAGAFFNYNVVQSGGSATPSALEGAGELGARLGDFLVTSDGYAFRDPGTGRTRAARLSTTVARDDRETLQRLALGDFISVPTTNLGSSLRLGGLSFSRRFGIDPYYVRFPGQLVSGTATLPSEVLVYSNGVLIRRDRVSPGAFELQNIVNVPGLHVTEVVVRDVLGNEQRIVDPFYFTESLLRPGLDEYSFDAGLERRQFGLRSSAYGGLGYSMFYRRGVQGGLTLGAYAEGLERRRNFGPSVTAGLGALGVVSGALGLSAAPAGSGSALSLQHSFQSTRAASSLALRAEDRGFVRALPDPLGPRRYDLSAALSYAVTPASGVSFGLTSSAYWQGPSARSASLGYRMRATRDLYLAAILRRTSGALAATELQFTATWSLELGGQRALASGQLTSGGGRTSQLAQLSGGNPDSEGLVYRVNLEQRRQPDSTQRTLNPLFQYNFPHAIVRAESFHTSPGGTERTQLGVQGGIATIEGHWALTRPVTDSFAIVKVDALPGIRVYANNQLIGRTGGSGTLFVPRLASYFENPVAIEDKDLPLNAIVPEVRTIVSPALRSGMLIDFQARFVSAISARLLRDGKPLQDARGSVSLPDGERELRTGRDGRFYLEDVPPGRHSGAAGAACRFVLQVPSTQEVVNDLGEVSCAP